MYEIVKAFFVNLDLSGGLSHLPSVELGTASRCERREVGRWVARSETRRNPYVSRPEFVDADPNHGRRRELRRA